MAARTLQAERHLAILALAFAFMPCAVAQSGVWTVVVASGPSARSGHAMAYDAQRQRVMMFGGRDALGLCADTWAWDGLAWQLLAATGPSAREGHAVSYDAQRAVIVMFGGQTQAGDSAETWEWNGNSWLPHLFVAPPPARRGHAMAYDSQSGRTVVFGGMSSSAFLGDTWEWDGGNWIQAQVAGPTARREHAMAACGTSGVLLLGGEGEESRSGSYYICFGGCGLVPWSSSWRATRSDAWLWSSGQWTRLSRDMMRPRSSHALALDPAGGRHIVMGGHDEQATFHPGYIGTGLPYTGAGQPGSVTTNPISLPDTHGTWDCGSSWVSLDNSLPALEGHAMAYDIGRERFVMFGGVSSGVPQAVLYELDRSAGSSASFGVGCGTPPLSMTQQPGYLPAVNRDSRVVVSNVPSGVAFLMFGWSNSSMGVFPLPIDLGGYGMPGCFVRTSDDSGLLMMSPAASNTATYSLSIPNQSGLISLVLHLQAWALAPGVNAGGAVSSNGLTWTVGF